MGKISNKSIVIKGAEMHNLKNIDLKIPKTIFIVRIKILCLKI